MKLWKNIKRKVKKNEQPSAASPPGGEREFLAFYKSLSAEIKSHLEYQTEMTSSSSLSAKVVKNFDIAEYIGRVEHFFRIQQLLGPESDEIRTGNMLLLLLLPPKPWNIAISREIREYLFCGLLNIQAREMNLAVAPVLKGLYDRIKHGGDTYFDRTKDELAEAVRDAAARLAMEDQTSAVLQSKEELDELRERIPFFIFHSLDVSSEKDLEKVLHPLFPIDTAISISVLTAVAMTMFLRPDIPASIMTGLFSESANLYGSTFFGILAVLLMVWSVIRAHHYGKQLSRRKILYRMLKRAKSSNLTSSDQIELFALKRFGYRKHLP